MDPLDQGKEFSLDDLAECAAAALARLRVRPDDGRVTPVPDGRTIRYYQTAGLLDKPLRYDGRRAVYGRRHLLQLVAIKRLQEAGHPLHLIQGALAGRSTQELAARLAAEQGGGGQEERASDGSPAAPHPAHALGAMPVQSHRHATAARRRVAPASHPAGLIAAEVAPGITVTIDPRVVDDPQDILDRVASVVARGTSEEGS